MGPCIAMGAAAAHALDLAGSGSVQQIDIAALSGGCGTMSSGRLRLSLRQNAAGGLTRRAQSKARPRYSAGELAIS